MTQLQRCIQPVAETYSPHSDISDALINARSMQFVRVIHHLFIYLIIYLFIFVRSVQTACPSEEKDDF